MKRINKSIVMIMVAALVLSMATVGVSAEESLSEIREKIKEKEAELEAGQEEEESLASQVVELETEINRLDGAISEGEAKLVVLEQVDKQ